MWESSSGYAKEGLLLYSVVAMVLELLWLDDISERLAASSLSGVMEELFSGLPVCDDFSSMVGHGKELFFVSKAYAGSAALDVYRQIGFHLRYSFSTVVLLLSSTRILLGPVSERPPGVVQVVAMLDSRQHR